LVALVLYGLSAPHTAGVFDKLTPGWGWIAPVGVEFGLLYAAFRRRLARSDHERLPWTLWALEILLFLTTMLVNGAGSFVSVIEASELNELSFTAIAVGFGNLPATSQAALIMALLSAFIIPIGALVAGDGHKPNGKQGVKQSIRAYLDEHPGIEELSVNQVYDVPRKEDKTLSQVAAGHGLHPNLVSQWRDQARSGMASLFSRTKETDLAAQEAAHEQEKQELYAEIGRLTTQLSWLKKKLASSLSRDERLALVEREGSEVSVAGQCGLLSLNRSEVYYAPRPAEGRTLLIQRRSGLSCASGLAFDASDMHFVPVLHPSIVD
jgi:transposase-like protein